MIRIVNRVLESDYYSYILNEDFFGRKPEFKQVEQIFAEYKDLSHQVAFDDLTKIIKNDARLAKILCNLFGFARVQFNLDDDRLRPATMSTEKTIGMISRGNPKSKENINLKRLEKLIQQQDKYYTKETIPSYSPVLPYDYFEDASGQLHKGTPFEAVDNLIIDNDGIRFNRNKIQMDLIVYIQFTTLANPACTPEMLTAMLIHEIGHNFTVFMIDVPDEYKKKGMIAAYRNNKADESFADQFAAMYGYGSSLIKMGKMSQVYRMKVEFGDLDSAYSQERSNSILQRTYANPHLADVNRAYNIINQMKSDLRRPNLSDERKIELKGLLKDAKKLISSMDKGSQEEQDTFKLSKEISEIERKSNQDLILLRKTVSPRRKINQRISLIRQRNQ